MTDPTAKPPAVITQEFQASITLHEPPLEDGQPYKLSKIAQAVKAIPKDIPVLEIFPWER